MREKTKRRANGSRKAQLKKEENNKLVEFLPWQWESLNSKCEHFAMIGGVATGKTFTGSHFVISQVVNFPDQTGFIGANTYDQLSQATLRELMYWLDEYGFEYVIDRIPFWTKEKKFKSYNNILSIRVGNKTAYIFTRVLGDANPLRGIEFSWYWLDESRDTPLNTHDVIMSRLRESKTIRGLVTTTPAGEDWVWKRFVWNKDARFGYIKAKTEDSAKYGIITQNFYLTLRSSYSPVMAAQELDAEFVIVLEGRSYYTASPANEEFDYEPSDYELFVGMDFNFAPAPCVWEVGQIDDDGDVHVFAEISGKEVSSAELARRLAIQFGDYHLRIFGDASGNRGTTSNAGKTDYDQIAEVLSEYGVSFSIDVDQANPMVKDRVENTCRLLEDGNGKRTLKYDPNKCPYLHEDFRKVVWKNGKVSGNGDETLTHASDGLGYSQMKLNPPMGGKVKMGKNVGSLASKMGE
jgi:phage terminase large subunit-like protein